MFIEAHHKPDKPNQSTAQARAKGKRIKSGKGGDGKYQYSENHPKLFQKGGRLMYQPVMSEENVRRLYHLKLEKGRPMTRLLDEILNTHFQHHEEQNKNIEGGENSCTNARSAETHSKSNGRETEGITTTSATDTAPSAAPNTTP
jgi:hypothetical protein